MLVRDCAGGLVFKGNKVFILKNEKGEWVFPKGVKKNGDLLNEVAIKKVKEETGISAEIVSTAGSTNYEFFSFTRKRPVCNKITWYAMKCNQDKYKISDEKFADGGFFDFDEALRMITYSQDKSLLNLTYEKYKALV